MANTPESYDPIIQALEDAADGAAAHGATIGLMHNDEPAICGSLYALVGVPAGPGGQPPAVPGFKAAWNTAQRTSPPRPPPGSRWVPSRCREAQRTKRQAE